MLGRIKRSSLLLVVFIAGLMLSACGQISPTVVPATSTSAASPTTAPTQAPNPTVSNTATSAASPNTVPTIAATATSAPIAPRPTVIMTPQVIPAIAPTATVANVANFTPKMQTYPVPSGSAPHDVAPAPDGTVWYTAQRTGELGILDPTTGKTKHIKLGRGSAPHGVIAGPDGAAWLTDSGLNAIVRVDPATEKVDVYPVPADRASYVNMNTAAFDKKGVLWWTGQTGFYGSFNPANSKLTVYDAPKGRGPYGIVATPDGNIYYASLAGSHITRIDTETGQATVIEPPTKAQGARRVWSDSQGRIWVSEWNSGQISLFNPKDNSWKEWKLPGNRPQTYAVYVDEQDMVWLSDFGANTMVRFDPKTERFESFPHTAPNANVRQILGRPGEVWGAESGLDRLVVMRTKP
jgi:virginiamycin B lyase